MMQLSTRQRFLLVFLLMAGGQGCVIGGLTLGWPTGWIIGGSALCAILSLASFLRGASVQEQYRERFAAHAGSIGEGDLSEDIRLEGPADAVVSLKSLSRLQGSLRQSIGAIRGNADGVYVAANEIASGNIDLSKRTEQTSASLQQTASSMAQLTSTVNQTAESARTANQLVNSASEVAQRGGSVVSQVVSTMDEINTSSKKIADIISVIDGIAFQTNILALNAAVEAARAGEQGRGFAVVASEVRSLAQRSAEAAKEIKALIGASVDKVESGAKLVADAGSTMTEIVASVQRVSDIIGEISAAAAEQSSGIGQINGAIAQLDQMTQQNAALVEESAAAAESLREQSRQLSTVVSSFRLDGQSSPMRGAADLAPPAPHPVSAPAPRAPAPAAVAARKAIGHAKETKAFKPAAPAAKPASPAAPAPAPVAQPSSSDSDWETF
jgi:methyl-accepting chemotaxis protein